MPIRRIKATRPVSSPESASHKTAPEPDSHELSHESAQEPKSHSPAQESDSNKAEPQPQESDHESDQESSSSSSTDSDDDAHADGCRDALIAVINETLYSLGSEFYELHEAGGLRGMENTAEALDQALRDSVVERLNEEGLTDCTTWDAYQEEQEEKARRAREQRRKDVESGRRRWSPAGITVRKMECRPESFKERVRKAMEEWAKE